jgi:hypothetical protein
MVWWAILLIVLGSLVGLIGLIVIFWFIFLAGTADSVK